MLTLMLCIQYDHNAYNRDDEQGSHQTSERRLAGVRCNNKSNLQAFQLIVLARYLQVCRLSKHKALCTG